MITTQLFWPRLLLVLAGCASVTALGCAEEQRPDVVIVSIDTLRADRLGCYGYETASTPEIDRLAAEGVRFARCTAPTPVTLPSHASLLSGRVPARHGVRNNGTYRVPAELPWLPQRLREAGYATGGFVGAFPLAARFGMGRGFDRYDDSVRASTREDFHPPERPAGEVVDSALEWVRSVPGQRPLFLFAHFFEPHAPYEPPADLAARFPESPYDGEVAAADRAVARLRAGLKAAGRDDVILVIVSDHGEALGDHGEETHGLTLFESTQRVPWILHAPGRVPAATVIEGRVGLVDVAPTLLDLLDIPAQDLSPESAFDGRVIDPNQGEVAARSYWIETVYPFELYRWAPAFARIEDERKVIRSRVSRAFDLRADADEEDDQIDVAPWATSALAEVDRWIEAEAGGMASTARSLTAAEQEQLAALGYGGGLGGDSARASGEDWLEWSRILPDVSERRADFERMNEAVRELGAGDPEAALATLRVLLEGGTENPWAHMLAASAHESLGQVDPARIAYEEADRQRPDWLAAKLALARLEARAGRPEDAAVWFRAAAALAGGSSQPWIESAECFTAAGLADRAVATLDDALADPSLQVQDRARVEAAMASLHLRMGRPEEGRPHLDRALENLSEPGIDLIAARYAMQDQRWEAAREFLERATSGADAPATAWFERGELARRTGDLPGAIDGYRRAVNLEGAPALASNNLAWLLATEAGRAEEAVGHARRAVELEPESADFRDTLIESLLRAGRPAAARDELERALSHFPDHPGLVARRNAAEG